MTALAGRRPAPGIAASRTRTRRVAPLAVGLLSLLVLVERASLGDYTQDAGPAIRMLVAGHVGRAIAHQPLMGAFAVLARAPFALAAHLAGAGELGVYRAGVVACALPVVVLAALLARRVDARPWAMAVTLLALLSPASLAAARVGHPEEALAAALLVGALLAAGRSAVLSGVLLGVAVATKQWAVVGIVPVLWAVAPGRRRLAGAAAAAVGLVLTLPLVLGGAGAFSATSRQAATSPQTTGRATVWFLFARPRTLHLHVPAGLPSTETIYLVPAWVARGAHPLIVLLPLLALPFLRRRRPTTGDALALLALLLLARCVLDPVDNAYYHLPFVLALLGYELTRRRLPLLTVAASAGLWLTFDRLDVSHVAPALTNGVYLAWTTAVAGVLTATLWRTHDTAAA